MATTIPTDGVVEAGRRRGSWGVANALSGAAIALAAVALLVAGGQATLRDLQRIPPAQFVETHVDQLENADDAAARHIRRRALDLDAAVSPAARQAEDLRRHAALFLMSAKEAAARGEPDTVRRDAEAAARLAREALHRNPVHPLGWVYLADATRLAGTDTASAFAHLQVSYAMAPVEPHFLAYRMGLAVAMNRHWEATFLQTMRRDLRGLLTMPIWHGAAQRFHAQAVLDPDLVRVAEILVRRDPDLQARWQDHAQRIGQ